jgi:hypothetical protein
VGIPEMNKKDEPFTGAKGKEMLHLQQYLFKSRIFETDEQKIFKFVSGSY